MVLFSENIILIPAVTYVVATLLKALYYQYKKNFSLKNVLGTGGMPSGHSALVTSLVTAVGISDGIHSTEFAISLFFAAIVIYDAMNIRFQSGLHAKAINRLHPDNEEKFNESLGHLPSEAIVGSLLGIVIAVVLMQF